VQKTVKLRDSLARQLCNADSRKREGEKTEEKRRRTGKRKREEKGRRKRQKAKRRMRIKRRVNHRAQVIRPAEEGKKASGGPIRKQGAF